MPRGRKKRELPALKDGLKDNNLVQKSRPLFGLWRSKLTLAEFKILDTYLSRINSHNPEERTVTLEKGKLEEFLGVKKINKTDLQKRLRHLQGTTVNIGEENNIDEITLFERSQAQQDEYGLWKIKLTASSSAMKYIFNIDNIGYIRYKVRCITQISSLYSYILFMYLEMNRCRKTWKVTLDELKNILNCTAERYKQYKFFNSEILKKSRAEIQEKTECRFTYEPIKKGRIVIAIKFTLETITDRLQLEPNKAISAGPEQSSLLSSENELSAYFAVCKNEFSAEQIKLLLDLMNFINENQRLSYFQYSYALLEEQANNSVKKIKNRFAYIKAIIKNDYTKFSKEQKQQTSSPNQKTYGGAYDLEAYENADPFADE